MQKIQSHSNGKVCTHFPLHLAQFFSLFLFADLCNCRSGTEEDYSELTQLLEDIYTFKQDLQATLNEEKEAKKKELDDKRRAEEMRNSAMETMARKRVTDVYKQIILILW